MNFYKMGKLGRFPSRASPIFVIALCIYRNMFTISPTSTNIRTRTHTRAHLHMHVSFIRLYINANWYGSEHVHYHRVCMSPKANSSSSIKRTATNCKYPFMIFLSNSFSQNRIANMILDIYGFYVNFCVRRSSSENCHTP